MSHAPTPWVYIDKHSPYGEAEVTHGVIQGDGEHLAVMVTDTPDGKANAAFIVRAVNRDHLFDELVEALRAVDEYAARHPMPGRVGNKVFAALAKAEAAS
jgi:hypothetical protein